MSPPSRAPLFPSPTTLSLSLSLAGDDGKTRYKFSEGAVTIKEVINKSFWGIFNTAGLLAQFKVVGTWDAFPIDALPDTPPPSDKASSE